MHLEEERREAIGELVNIGFGRAVASIADVLHTRLEMNVPEVLSIQPRDVVDFLIQSLGQDGEVSLVQEAFYGDFLGEAVLAFPRQSSRELAVMLSEDWGFQPDMESDNFEKEALLEIGNLVIGASLGQFAELLQTRVSFKPPQVFTEPLESGHFQREVTEHDGSVLMVQTHFQVAGREIYGYLFFLLSTRCHEWLFQEIDSFLDRLD
ncbi:chemotaxis protein CheC [Desulfohalobium retbaense]|uniref:CheC, inhibitor of MCP methylation n=1 Tax=Desulfohalobium retbaense (strain ATCC 49708 / DSM 5692 / JCM 16813 / HR100) TaxID=485915 RepID=C8X2S9_DESRD|nr:chemotaxis protein CheC [Desulfohalobium retbaense]ACV68726.1 CheC, inhibitor of MCP methylation [Desulfohalobium retbaense DSM 5692]